MKFKKTNQTTRKQKEERSHSGKALGDYTDEEIQRSLEKIRSSPTKFCEAVLGLKPFPYQVKFLEDSSKRIVVCAGRQVGKSLITAGRALWFAMVRPGTKTLIVSSTLRQSMLMFDKILRFIHGNALLVGSVLRETRTVVEFSNGSEIVALPCGNRGDSLRGHTAHQIIIDEAAYVPEEVITSVVKPMLSTTRGTLILISTPHSSSHYFCRAFNSSNWKRYHFKTSDNPLVEKEFLEEERSEIGELRFRQEYLAEFVDDEKSYFPMSVISSGIHHCDSGTCEYCCIFKGDSVPSGDLYCGYDPGGMRDPAAFVVIQRYLEENDEDGARARRMLFPVMLAVKYMTE